MEKQKIAVEEDQIDLLELLNVLYSHLLTILLCALLAGGAACLYSMYFITPLYQADIKMLVNARYDSFTTTVNVNDITAAESLVDTYAVVIKSDRVLGLVIEEMGLDTNWVTLDRMIKVSAVPNTAVIDIVCVADDPEFARQVVMTISEVAPEQIVDAVEAGSCKVLTNAYSSGIPISPSIKKNTLLGVAAGGCVSGGLFILLHLLNDTIQSEEQLAEVTGCPVLSTIPVVEEAEGASKKKHKKNRRAK